MSGCIFCSIIDKKAQAYILYEDDTTMALLDVFPSVSGHTMVIPKQHGATVADFSKEQLGGVMNTVKHMTSILERAFNTSIFTIGINHGESRGVPHLHIHIIPRYGDDGGGIVQSIVKERSKSSLDTVFEKITSVIRGK